MGKVYTRKKLAISAFQKLKESSMSAHKDSLCTLPLESSRFKNFIMDSLRSVEKEAFSTDLNTDLSCKPFSGVIDACEADLHQS